MYLQAKLTTHYPDLSIFYNDRKAVGLELDIYIPHLLLAFEVNGIFHYKAIYGQTKLDKTINHDLEKQRLCKEQLINLIVLDISGQNVFKADSAEIIWNIIMLEVEIRIEEV